MSKKKPRPTPVPAEPIPGLIDAHTHLASCGARDEASIAALMDRAMAAGVAGVCTIGDGLPETELAVAASRHAIYAACTDGCVYVFDAGDVARPAVPGEASALYEVEQYQNSLYARLALYDDSLLALGCHLGHVVLWDVSTRIRPDVDCHGFVRGGTVLTRLHNAEINDVSWTCGPHGPCLASACDDLTTRLWK